MTRVLPLVVTVVSNGFFGKEIIFQFLIENRVLPANPFQHHRRVFFFFVPVVGENGFQILVLAGVDPLVVPCLLYTSRCV